MVKEFVLEAIRKKLIGKALNAKEIYAIMDEISHNRLNPIFTTYFAAAGFCHGYSEKELYYLTKAMVETGEKIKFSGIVADKHSTGGVAGTRTTMILVPIIASCGINIPKASSRAITSPSGTADTMEVLSPVTFSTEKIKKIISSVGGCIIWAGGLNLAPADDILIQIEKPLSFESFDKIIVSIMAKKIACGATHVILDIPVGPTMKIQHYSDAEIIGRKFSKLAKDFSIKISLDVNYTAEPAGNGLGPVLEARDVLEVLEQKNNRPKNLEKKALRLSGKLLDLCLTDTKFKKNNLDIKKRYKELNENGQALAEEMLKNGRALKKMREIIKIQGGDPDVSSERLELAPLEKEIKSDHKGKVVTINNKNLSAVCRILGCPEDKKSGIYLQKKIGDYPAKNEVLYIIYSTDKWKLKEAEETIGKLDIYKIE